MAFDTKYCINLHQGIINMFWHTEEAVRGRYKLGLWTLFISEFGFPFFSQTC